MKIAKLWESNRTLITCGIPDEGLNWYVPVNPVTENLKSLNLGCGCSPCTDDNWVNVDLFEGPHVDVVHNCNEPLPFKDNEFKFVYSSHLLEHLESPVVFMDEIYRIVHPGGAVMIRVPHIQNCHSWAEPDHKRMYPEHFFYWLQPDADKNTRNLTYTGRQHGWMVRIVYHVLTENHKWLLRFPLKARLFLSKYLWNICAEMIVVLTPVK